MVEQTPGQRTAAEHSETAGIIREKTAEIATSPDQRPMSLWEETRMKAVNSGRPLYINVFGIKVF